MSMREPVIVLFASVILNFTLVYSGYSQPLLYEGKTITIIQGRGAGGTGDLRVRAVIPFLKKYIAGKPTIISAYMPGGGGRKAANHIYKLARPDGLTVGNVGGGLATNAILGATGVEYDLDRLIFLGSTNTSQHYVFFTYKTAGLNTLEKLRDATRIRIGARSVGGELYTKGRLFSYLLGMKEPKFILGYSAEELYTAMVQGEIQARAVTADPLLRAHSDWVQEGRLDFHAVLEIPKGLRHGKFGHLPELETFAVSDQERKLLAMDRGIRLFGTSYFLPPDTPKEQVQILRKAFRNAFKDPQFPGAFKKLTGEDPDPLTPEAMAKILKELPRDPQIISLYRKLASTDPLPVR